MDLLKGLAIALLALGMTWGARAATDAVWRLPRPQLSSQVAGQAAPAPASPPASASPAQDPGREAMEAELRRAKAGTGTRPGEEELREFRPTRPLSADLAIALPSDI